MAIDASTQVLMANWALWRFTRGQPGMAITMAYSLMGGGGSGQNGTIVLLNDEAFEVEQAVLNMAQHLRQAIEEYWLKSEPVDKKARRCSCPVRTYWRRLQRGHEAVHTYRRELHERQKRAREAYQAGDLSFGF